MDPSFEWQIQRYFIHNIKFCITNNSFCISFSMYFSNVFCVYISLDYSISKLTSHCSNYFRSISGLVCINQNRFFTYFPFHFIYFFFFKFSNSGFGIYIIASFHVGVFVWNFCDKSFWELYICIKRWPQLSRKIQVIYFFILFQVLYQWISWFIHISSLLSPLFFHRDIGSAFISLFQLLTLDQVIFNFYYYYSKERWKTCFFIHQPPLFFWNELLN